MVPWRDGWYRYTMLYASSTAAATVIGIMTSATSIRAEVSTLNTTIYATGAQIEESPFATSYTPATTAAVMRAGEDFEEILKPYMSMSDILGSGVTTSHIELPVDGADTAAMSSLQVETPPGLLIGAPSSSLHLKDEPCLL
jgi:hypothetical protein